MELLARIYKVLERLSLWAVWLGGLSLLLAAIMIVIFCFAAFWKASSAEYVSGAFFEYTLLLDDRFLPMTRLFGG